MGPMMGKNKKTTTKVKNIKGTSKKLISTYLSKHKISLIVISIFAIASTIFAIIGPKVLGDATTEIYNGIISKIQGGTGIDFKKIGQILLILLLLYVTSTIFSCVQGYMMTGVAQKITYKMRKDISKKINKLPMKYFDGKTKGEVLSIITNDVDILSDNLNQSITQVITSIFTIIGILIMMFSINWQMTLISLTILPISAVILKFIVKHSQKYFVKQQEYLAKVNGQVEEVYSGLTIVKAFNSEEKVKKEFEKRNKELRKSAWRSQFFSGVMYPIMNFVGNAGYVAVAIIGGYFAIQGKIKKTKNNRMGVI